MQLPSLGAFVHLSGFSAFDYARNNAEIKNLLQEFMRTHNPGEYYGMEHRLSEGEDILAY